MERQLDMAAAEQGDLGAQEKPQGAAATAASSDGGRGGRRALRDASPGAPAVSDWTRFDVQSSLVVRRTGATAIHLWIPRKLHRWWWQASAHTQ